MANITKESYIDNLLCLLHRNGVDISTLVRKNVIEDDSDIGFHIVTRYEVTTWETSPKYILKHCKKNSKSKYLKEVGINSKPTTVSFFSRLKYSLYLVELLKESQMKVNQ